MYNRKLGVRQRPTIVPLPRVLNNGSDFPGTLVRSGCMVMMTNHQRNRFFRTVGNPTSALVYAGFETTLGYKRLGIFSVWSLEKYVYIDLCQ